MTAGLLLALAPHPAAAAAPPRIMSISLCTDQLLLALVPPQRIASVTWLARDAANPAVAAAARRVAFNHQSAEEVLRQKPSLVLAGSFTAPATLGMLRRLGYPVVEVPSAYDFAQIRAITRQVGAAVGAPRRAEAWIAHMDAVLRSLATSPIPDAPRVAAWDGTRNLPRRGTLYDAVVTAAGARNIGREPGLASGGFGLEEMLAAAPALLIHDEVVGTKPGQGTDLVAHPLVRRFWRDRQLVIPQDYFICGTPFSADAALRLHRDMLRTRAVWSRPLPFAGAPSAVTPALSRGPASFFSRRREGSGTPAQGRGDVEKGGPAR